MFDLQLATIREFVELQPRLVADKESPAYRPEECVVARCPRDSFRFLVASRFEILEAVHKVKRIRIRKITGEHTALIAINKHIDEEEARHIDGVLGIGHEF